MGEVEGLAKRLLEAVAAQEGGLPQRLIVEPCGQHEVNARAMFRGVTHPVVFHQRFDKEIRSQKA